MRIKFLKYPYRRYKILGCYDKVTSSLIIQKDLKLSEKIATGIHEFGHYLIDKLHLGRYTDYTYDVVCVLIDPAYTKKKKTFRWLAKYYWR